MWGCLPAMEEISEDGRIEGHGSGGEKIPNFDEGIL